MKNIFLLHLPACQHVEAQRVDAGEIAAVLTRDLSLNFTVPQNKSELQRLLFSRIVMNSRVHLFVAKNPSNLILSRAHPRPLPLLRLLSPCVVYLTRRQNVNPRFRVVAMIVSSLQRQPTAAASSSPAQHQDPLQDRNNAQTKPALTPREGTHRPH